MIQRRDTPRGAMLLCLVLLLAASCGRSGQEGPVARVEGGGLRLEVSPEPPTPRQGANRLRVRVHDAAGMPVDDATVEVHARMQMAGMAPMETGGAAKPAGAGSYDADLDLGMAGTWRLVVEAKRGGTSVARGEGTLTTGQPGLRLGEASARSGEHAGHVAEVRIAPERMQAVGIRSAPVELAPFDRVVRAVGRVTWDETALFDVSLKVRGFVEKLEADAVGMRVERGQPLLWIYSPELYAAQEEYLSAHASREASGGARSEALTRAARTRLRLWDLSDAEIDALERRGVPAKAVPMRSPATGVVIEKDVTLGAAVEPGQRLFRIAPSEDVWVEAELQESELPGVAAGQPATVTLPSLPGRRFDAKVAYTYPYLDRESRSLRVRLALANAEGVLLPDMYANVELRVPRGERLLVPTSAVLYAGPRRIVFVDLGEGRLEPRDIEIGTGNGEAYEVLSGLSPGERVVVSGNFLVAAESRLQSALEQW